MDNSLPELDVPSPCIKVCRVDAGGRCEGCFRVLDEIANWTSMSGQQKRAVVEACEERKRVQGDWRAAEK